MNTIVDAECGIVKVVHGNMVCVAADAVSFCNSCSNEGCSMRQSSQREVWIENTLGAHVGDRVFFVVPAQGIILSSMLLYGLPIMFLFAGIIIKN